ncbi:hypothetical protein EGJ22_07975 [Pseudomonas sp. p99-361]|nr:hypothetical protein HV87_02875 [Pseudomonas aeruginosa]QEQ89719.1 hypothetical protein F1602_21515 [Pseudomonas putida]RRV20461.1 hypothetical protein EGJ22_07975 [Pseudomonas sp. p99-361]
MFVLRGWACMGEGGLPANTGVAGASYRAGFFAGTPAPTQGASRLRIEFSSRQRSPLGCVISHNGSRRLQRLRGRVTRSTR